MYVSAGTGSEKNNTDSIILLNCFYIHLVFSTDLLAAKEETKINQNREMKIVQRQNYTYNQ